MHLSVLEFCIAMTRSPKWPWITLLALQAVQLLSLLPWLLLAGISLMAFDAPGSEKTWQPWAIVLGIWSYPLWLLLTAIASWLLFVFHHYKSAITLSVVFTLPLPAMLFLFTI